MRPVTRHTLNAITFVLIQFFLAGFQTSFWPDFFGPLPAPLMWVTTILYFALYRRNLEGILICYGTAFVLRPYTSMSFAMISLLVLGVFFAARFVKARIFWPGLSYFISATALSVAAIPLLHLVFSRIAENNPVSSYPFLSTLGQVVLSPIAAFIGYQLFNWFDQATIPDVTFSQESPL